MSQSFDSDSKAERKRTDDGARSLTPSSIFLVHTSLSVMVCNLDLIDHCYFENFASRLCKFVLVDCSS